MGLILSPADILFLFRLPCLPVPGKFTLQALCAGTQAVPEENSWQSSPKPSNPTAQAALCPFSRPGSHHVFPQNMAPECRPQKGCKKPSWATSPDSRILPRAVQFYPPAAFLEKLCNTIDLAGLNRCYLLFTWRRGRMLEHAEAGHLVHLFRLNTVWAEVRPGKSSSKQISIKFTHTHKCTTGTEIQSACSHLATLPGHILWPN